MSFKTNITLRLEISLSKIFAFMVAVFGFLLSKWQLDPVYFITAIPISGAAVGIKQYLDNKKNIKNEQNG